MPANIAYTNGRAHFAYTGQAPWWGIGNGAIKGRQTAHEMLSEAGMLGWNITMLPTFAKTEDGSLIELGNGRAAVRMDTRAVLGRNLTTTYVPIQNEENEELADAIMGHGVCFEIAGALGNGETCWLLGKLSASEFEVVSGDSVETYFLLSWGHDGTRKVAGRLTPIRVVCQNTLGQAESGTRASFAIKHTRNAQVNIEEARKALGLVRKQASETAGLYRRLAAHDMTVDQARSYIAECFPYPQTITDRESRLEREREESRALVADLLGIGGRDVADALDATKQRIDDTRDVVLSLLESGKGTDIPGVQGTVWGAYNAVTEYVDHVYPILKSGKVSPDRQQSALFGAYADVKATALDLAIAATR